MNARYLRTIGLASTLLAGAAGLRAAEPIAWYHFEEGDGVIVHDASPHHHDGRIRGDVAWSAAGIRGACLLLDGRNRVSIPSGAGLDLSGPHTISLWIRGHPSPMHFVEGFAPIDALYFQVCGDTIYAAAFSDAANRTFPSRGPTLRGSDIPSIYSGRIDLGLGDWRFVRRTTAPRSGFEPKMQVVRDHIYYEYTGRDDNRIQQIWTTESDLGGNDYRATQRSFVTADLTALPPDRPDLADSKRVGDAIYRVDHGAIAVAGGKVYIAYPAQDAHNVWQFDTAVCAEDHTATVRRTADHGWIPCGIQVAGDRVYYLFPKGDDVFETYSHALVKGSNPQVKTVEGVYVASTDRAGGDWRIVARVGGPCPAADCASFQVANGRIYLVWAQLDPDGSGHSKLFTGSMALDGTNFHSQQRTFDAGFTGTSLTGGVQVVGNRLYYVFNERRTAVAYADLYRTRFADWALWTAEANLDGSDWTAARVTSGPRSMLAGYHGMTVVGAKRYLAPLDAPDPPHPPAYGHGPGMLGFDGANLVSKGDAYGLGITGAGRARAFLNAGEDYLFRGDGSTDTAGAIADGATPVSDDAWHHAAEVFDGTRLRLYLDGKLAAETRYSSPPATNPFPLILGDGFIGWLDEVRLYDQALSPDEIARLALRP